MAEIVDTEEVDKNTVTDDVLEQQFSQNYNLLFQTEVAHKKSYINKLHGTKSLKIAAGLSDNSIEVFELNNTSLSSICRLSGHKKDLSEVVFSPKEDYLLYSCGQDGVVKLWDTRAKGSCVQEYKSEEESEELTKRYDCMDVSCNARVLCAGSLLVQDEAYLVFWDQRMPAPLGGYWDSHTDDISQVRFHPTKPEVLASGALDNLVNVYNVLEPREDDALTYSLNVENSVDRINWLDGDRLACITQSNDLQLWDAATGDRLSSYSRDKVARSIKRSRGDDCYLVDAFVSGLDTVLLAGSHADGAVLRSVSVGESKLRPRSAFPANTQTVRCCFYHAERDLLVTAGEAGALAVWGRAGAEGAGAEGAGAEGAGGRLASKLSKLHVKRHKPY